MPFDGFGPHPSVGEYLWLQQQERIRQEYWADQAERERLAYEAAEEEELETSEAWQREVDRVVREQAREQREAEEREAARLREQAREQREAEERKRDAARLREQERRDRAVASGVEVELLFQHAKLAGDRLARGGAWTESLRLAGHSSRCRGWVVGPLRPDRSAGDPLYRLVTDRAAAHWRCVFLLEEGELAEAVVPAARTSWDSRQMTHGIVTRLLRSTLAPHSAGTNGAGADPDVGARGDELNGRQVRELREALDRLVADMR